MKIPKIKTTMSFLSANGWKVAEESDKYYFMKPPENIEFDYEFRYRIPKVEGEEEFKEYMLRTAFSIAAMYEWKKQDLLDVVSKSIKELEEDLKKHEKEIKKISKLKEVKQSILGIALTQAS